MRKFTKSMRFVRFCAHVRQALKAAIPVIAQITALILALAALVAAIQELLGAA